MESGKVKLLVATKGYGFVRGDRGAEYFFHATRTENFDALAVGDSVAFDIGPGRDGRHALT